MKKILILLPLCFLLTGCASLLERSYSVVEPYSDRYWDSTAEDTLRAENHQDLVNSLLMLVEQRAEEGVIRCYSDANSYLQAQSACREVSKETALGAYLLEELTFTYENGTGYCSVTCHMTYREDADDPASIMTLSDSQSLVDLLRLAVREELTRLTACFVRGISREEVAAAVESLWAELCQDRTDVMSPLDPDAQEDLLPDGMQPGGEETDIPAASLPADIPADASSLPSCPWTIRFFPDSAAPEIVEVLLTSA